jgi:AraC-like DNA-binding protein
VNAPVQQRLRAAWRRRRAEFAPFPGAARWYCGLERQTDPTAYDWDGLRRAGDPRHPRLLWQYTLGGWGEFAQGGRLWRVAPGQAFAAVIPSAHRYRLPAASPGWSFCWLIIEHPYVVRRMAGWLERLEPVATVPADSALLAASVRLIEGAAAGMGFADALAQEQALFDWMFAFERWAEGQLFPAAARSEWLEELRSYTRQNLARAFNVAEVAARRGLSRSAYSHRFRAHTGHTPAQVVLEVRLEEATTRLRDPMATLKQVAAETGFADATHFGKCFRRERRMTPGAFRRQLGHGA